MVLSKELTSPGRERVFAGEHLREIAFPLGGIGAGTISLGGRGDLRDWEIFNRPGKGTNPPFTFFAIQAQAKGEESVAKVLEARLQPPFGGAHGVPTALPGLPRLESATFHGSYPFARIRFRDRDLPVRVTLEAFNPMIPLEVDDSSLPVAILTYRLQNPGRKSVRASVMGTVCNVAGSDGTMPVRGLNAPCFGRNVNRLVRGREFTGVLMTTKKYGKRDARFGSMMLATTAPQANGCVSWQEKRTGGWTDPRQVWGKFRATGRPPDIGRARATPEGRTDVGSLAASVTLKPGETAHLRFLIAWHFPNRPDKWSMVWNMPTGRRDGMLRNWYGKQFADALDVTKYVVKHLERLEAGTREFEEALSGSTLPAVVTDAVSSQMSAMRTNTCFRLDDGKLYGFEGCSEDVGCCPLNCTHVWNYVQAVAHLYPALERGMREVDFEINTDERGNMAFRSCSPPTAGRWKSLPAADGQMGCIVRLYREWQFSGDDRFLKRLWPRAKKALEFAWKEWDRDRDGLMEGRQHNTLDINYYGPNPMTGVWYLAALKAGAAMARAVGDEKAARKYEAVFARGAKNFDRVLFNGEYYEQKIDQRKHPIYQAGKGCMADQLVGQWAAHVVGLGYLLNRAHARCALRSVVRYNWKQGLSSHHNAERAFALNDESALLVCTWPKGGRPAVPSRYSEEALTGSEYQVAAHCIYEGMIEEGLRIVKGVRDRHDGRKRNPYNEPECGDHYSRAMSNWSLMLALSGFGYSGVEGVLRFGPRIHADDFRCFFSTGTAWGVYRQRKTRALFEATIELRHGSLSLQKLVVETTGERTGADVRLGRTKVEAIAREVPDGMAVVFAKPVSLGPGESLRLRM